MPKVLLQDRAYIAIGGKDAADFLQGLITTDIAAIVEGGTYAGALLTPQGKILFDFLVSKADDGFLLETEAIQRDGLLKRLSMYKLRAEVTLSIVEESATTVAWGDAVAVDGLQDMRFAKAGVDVRRSVGGSPVDAEAFYQRLRIENGIAESGSDFALSDAFPHDVMLDLNGGVSFKKGCYVGQEVVSRMQHRSTARRRIVIIQGERDLPSSGSELSVDGKAVGILGSVIGASGLALARIDKLGAALALGKPVTIGDVPVSVSLPAWSGLTFPSSTDEAIA